MVIVSLSHVNERAVMLGPYMRNVGCALLLILSSRADSADGFSLHVRRQGVSLIGKIFATGKVCIVTYKIYYERLGLLRVYGKRPGIDIRGECEIEVRA